MEMYEDDFLLLVELMKIKNVDIRNQRINANIDRIKDQLLLKPGDGAFPPPSNPG